MLKKISCLPLLIIVLSLSIGNLFSTENLILDKVIIEGAEQISPDELIKHLNLPKSQQYEPELGSEIIIKLQNYLTQKGFYFAKVKQVDIIPTDNSRVKLALRIDEGFTGVVYEIRFNGNKYFSDSKIRQLLDMDNNNQTGLTQLPGIMTKALNLYTSRGYLFALVNLDSLLLDADKLSAVIGIDEGPLFKSTNYLFWGNKITKPSTLLKISGLRNVETVTPDIIALAEDNILKKEYIRECRIMPLDSGTLGIEIEEGRMTKAEGVFGLSNNPETNKRDLNGFVNLQFLNLWGTDRAIRLSWKNLSKQKSKYQFLELAYHESGMIEYPIVGDLLFQRAQQDSAWIRIKLQTSLFYQYFNHQFGTELFSESLYPDTPDSSGYEKTKYYGVSFVWEYDKTNYFANPSSGNQFRIKSGWLFSQSENTSQTTPVNEIDAVHYFPIKQKLVLANGLHYREISDKNAKIHEQYSMGGFKSLRGYQEDAFSSWRLGWINNEIRYLMTRDSRLYLLLDYGFLQITPDRIKSDLYGVGAGISNKTRIGVISISYALSIVRKQLPDWDSGMLHMGLVSSF